MKLGWALARLADCLAACLISLPAFAQSDVSELEKRVLSGDLSPEDAIIEYCEGNTGDKTQDAFCSCPEEALQLLQQRLKSHRMDAS